MGRIIESSQFVIVIHDEPLEVASLAAKMERAARDAVSAYGDCIIIHDARNMRDATEAYARSFAPRLRTVAKLPGVRMWACIPRAVPRVMAKVAIALSGIHMKIVPDCDALFREPGFDDAANRELLQRALWSGG